MRRHKKGEKAAVIRRGAEDKNDWVRRSKAGYSKD